MRGREGALQVLPQPVNTLRVDSHLSEVGHGERVRVGDAMDADVVEGLLERAEAVMLKEGMQRVHVRGGWLGERVNRSVRPRPRRLARRAVVEVVVAGGVVVLDAPMGR